MDWLFIHADRCFSRFGNKPMLNQIKFNAWLQHLATGLRCCKLSTNVCDWAMLNHSGSTIDRLKIIVKWGTFRPWRTLCHVIGGQGDIKATHLPVGRNVNGEQNITGFVEFFQQYLVNHGWNASHRKVLSTWIKVLYSSEKNLIYCIKTTVLIVYIVYSSTYIHKFTLNTVYINKTTPLLVMSRYSVTEV